MKITALLLSGSLFYCIQAISMSKIDMEMFLKKTVIENKVNERFQKLAWAVYWGGHHVIKTQEEAVKFIQLVQEYGIAPERAGIIHGPDEVQVYEGSKKVTRDNRTGQYTVN